MSTKATHLNLIQLKYDLKYRALACKWDKLQHQSIHSTECTQAGNGSDREMESEMSRSVTLAVALCAALGFAVPAFAQIPICNVAVEEKQANVQTNEHVIPRISRQDAVVVDLVFDLQLGHAILQTEVGSEYWDQNMRYGAMKDVVEFLTRPSRQGIIAFPFFGETKFLFHFRGGYPTWTPYRIGDKYRLRFAEDARWDQHLLFSAVGSDEKTPCWPYGNYYKREP